VTYKRLGRDFKDQSIRNVMRAASSFLDSTDRSKIYLVTGAQLFLAVLDLIAVTIIGIVTALALSGVQSKNPPEQIEEIIRILNLDGFVFQVQVAILGSIAATIMISKTLASVFLIRRMLFFLAHKSAKVSTELSVRVMKLPYEYIKRNSSQSILFAVTQGVNSLVLGVIGSTVQIIAESCLIIIMLIGLFSLEPTVSLGALVYFASIAFIQQQVLGSKASSLGHSSSQANVYANQKVIEALNLYREIYVRQALENYSLEISTLRQQAASVTAKINFFPYINKYVLEVSLVLGALLLSASQFILVDSMTAIATLSIFLAAATRVSPSILRLQQSLIGIKANIGIASKTLDLINDIKASQRQEQKDSFDESEHEIELKNVRFSYEDSNSEAIKGISLTINQGEMIAFVGPSGGGKSTLIDLMLGLLEPKEGFILVRGVKPKRFIESAPGRIGFVAQDSALLHGSIRENLVFGLDKKYSDEALYSILDKVSLREFVEKLPLGLGEMVGDRGILISGGQRQRMNIARAILTDPEILVLDEATSALDVETEQQIIDSIESIRQHRTIIIIAHRLSTVLKSDKIFFIEEGHLKGQGNFAELRKSLPDFDRQANLAGYTT
jgi:ABC-type multidrug transport system fused ATPase/permease subunit